MNYETYREHLTELQLTIADLRERIKELEAQLEPKTTENGSNTSENGENVPVKTTGDLISRQGAIDAVIEWYGCEPSDLDYFKEIVEKLPSAQPKNGKWIEDKRTEKENHLMFYKVWYCSECGEKQVRPNGSDFCPSCGADMRGGKHEKY